MKKEIHDENYPVGKLTPIPDFLPPPSELIFPDDNVKVTISLTKSCVAFFKAQAKKNHTKYQKMIRQVLNQYAGHYGKK